MTLRNDIFSTLWGSMGFGEENQRLMSKLDKAKDEMLTTNSIGRQLNDTIVELRELVDEYSEVGWDGYDALPLTEGAYTEAKRILENLLFFNIPSPEITAEPSGDIALEWYKGNNQIFILSVSGSNEIVYAGIFGMNKTHGKEYFFNSLPSIIIDNLRRLYS
jgi:hypothetical protein